MNWHSGRVLFALARYLDWWQTTLMPEIEIDGFREDMIQVSKAGYVSCYEIKISRQDWQSPKERGRFDARMTRKYCSRFFYVVPAELYDKGVPDFVPDWVGIISVSRSDHDLGYDHVREERAARRFKVDKWPANERDGIYRAAYYRFWTAHMNMQRGRLHDRPARASLGSKS